MGVLGDQLRVDAASADVLEADAQSCRQQLQIALAQLDAANLEIADLTEQLADCKAAQPHGMGTWVLATKADPAVLGPILAHPGVVGLSMAQGWKGYETSDGVFDTRLDDAGLAIARQAGKRYAMRKRGGVATPGFHMGRSYVAVTEPPPNYTKGTAIPIPVNPDGTPNATWLAGFRELVAQLSAYADQNPEIDILHLTHFGGASAELWITSELLSFAGVTVDSIIAAELALIDIAAAAPTGLPLELSVSGLKPIDEYRTLQAAFVDKLRAVNDAGRVFYDQRNGFSDSNISGAWPEGTNPPHGLQMIKPGDYDWIKVYTKAATSDAAYLEVYAESFGGANSTELYRQASLAYG